MSKVIFFLISLQLNVKREEKHENKKMPLFEKNSLQMEKVLKCLTQM